MSADKDIQRRVFSIHEFRQRNGVSRTTIYNEAKRGRLKLRKIGSKTVVTIEDEAAWLASLPVLGAAS